MGRLAEALEEAMKALRKEFGEMAVLRLGESADRSVASIPTGALSLDLALGVGGLPRGRVVDASGGLLRTLVMSAEPSQKYSPMRKS